MKWLIWIAFALLISLWTGLVVVTVQLTDWLLQAMATGQATDMAGLVSQWPLPAWLAAWGGTAWLEALQATLAGFLQWVGDWLPAAAGLMGWLTPLMWVVWGLVALCMVAVAVLAHWLVGRINTSVTRLRGG